RPGPAPVEVDHLLGHGGDRLAHPVPLFGPVFAAHPRDAGCLSPRVLGYGRQLVGRDIQAVLSLVGDHQVLALDAGHRAGHEALEAADAVLVMDDVVAFGQVSVVLALRSAPPPRPPVRTAAAGDLLLAEDSYPRTRRHEAVVDTGGEHHRFPGEFGASGDGKT